MSEYKHFIEDFTERSSKLFNNFIENAGDKYDVTLLLTFATPCFLVPYERLKDEGKREKAFSRNFDIYQDKYDDIRNDIFVDDDCVFNEELSIENIRYGFVKNIDDARNHNWEVETINKIKSDFINDKGKKVSLTVHVLFSTLRNGLAHGNIFTTGKPDIKQIVLAKKITRKDPTDEKCSECDQHQKPSIDVGWNCLIIDPDSFKQLLKNWFKWLESEGI